MKRALVISITRLGDVIQTVSLASSLRKQYPGAGIDLIINRRFNGVVPLISHVYDRIYLLDFGRINADLTADNMNYTGVYSYLKNFIKEINENQYDRVINLCPARLGAVLTFLIRAGEKRGITLDPYGYRIIKNPWMNLLHTSIMCRRFNPFNTVDLFTLGGGGVPGSNITLKIHADKKSFCKNYLMEKGVGSEDILFGFHMGASEDTKCWPVSEYVELARILTRHLKKAVFLLFGSKHEISQAEKFAELADGDIKTVHLTGRTDLSTLAAYINCCRLFVSGDTGPMHIASGVGTNVLSIFLGSSRGIETAPYNSDSVVVEPAISCHPCDYYYHCSKKECKSKITALSVSKIAETMVENQYPDFKKFGNLSGIKIYTLGFDRHNLLECRPVKPDASDSDALVRSLYKKLWLHLYGEKIKENNLTKNCSGVYVKDLFLLLDDLKLVEGFARKGAAVSKNLMGLGKNPGVHSAELQKCTELFKQIKHRIYETGKSSARLEYLCSMFRLSWENMEDGSLFHQAAYAMNAFNNLALQTSFLAQEIQSLTKFCKN